MRVHTSPPRVVAIGEGARPSKEGREAQLMHAWRNSIDRWYNRFQGRSAIACPLALHAEKRSTFASLTPTSAHPSRLWRRWV